MFKENHPCYSSDCESGTLRSVQCKVVEGSCQGLHGQQQTLLPGPGPHWSNAQAESGENRWDHENNCLEIIFLVLAKYILIFAFGS